MGLIDPADVLLKLHIILVNFLYFYATDKAAGNLKIEIVARRCEFHIY
jgi:hypothetical protein